jgi:hypothetical protein
MQLELGVDESYRIYIAAAGGVNSIVGGATIEVVFFTSSPQIFVRVISVKYFGIIFRELS